MANTDIELGEVDAIGETVRLLLAYEEGRDGDYRQPPSIFRVPSVQRNISPSSYDPKVVAIGPLHREAKNLQEMEARKPTYVHTLLADLELPREETLEACVQKVTAKINKIRESYDEMKSYTDDELAKMMVTDGLFILAIFCHLFKKDVLLFQSIIEDLVLLENQIPFFVLQDLYECTISKREIFSVSLIQFIILNVLYSVPLLELREDIDFQGTTPDHILSLLHMSYHPVKFIRPEFYRKKSIEPKFENSRLRSAIELDKAGVKFKRIQNPRWPTEIEVEPSRFGCLSWCWGKPTLRMPTMILDDYTESVTRNLIVYEQSSSLVPYITSYVAALDNLVDTREDIAMLMESGVLINRTGSNEEAASIINRINKKITCTEFFYEDQWNYLDRHYNRNWPKHIERLWRTYFSSPWTITALLAGIVLFALTIVQTIFAINAD